MLFLSWSDVQNAYSFGDFVAVQTIILIEKYRLQRALFAVVVHKLKNSLFLFHDER